MPPSTLNNFRLFERLPMQVVDLSFLNPATANTQLAFTMEANSRFVYIYDGQSSSNAAMLDTVDLSIRGVTNFGHATTNTCCQDNLYFHHSSSYGKMYIAPCGSAPVRTILGNTIYTPAKLPIRDISMNSLTNNVAMPTLASIGAYASAPSWMWAAENARYRVSPQAANTTYPSVADITDAPTLALSGGTGHLPASTVFVKLAWMTRTNTTFTRYGQTALSPAASLAVSLNDAITVTIPTFPANAIGCMIFAGTNENDLALSGVARVSGAHSLKAYYDQLNMGKMLFMRVPTYPALQRADLTNIASALSFTTASNPNPSNGLYGQLFSPFLPDFWNMYFPTGGNGAGNTRTYDVINTVTWSTAQNVTMPLPPLSGPLLHRTEMLQSSLWVLYFPELGAFVAPNIMYTSEGPATYNVFCAVTGMCLYSGAFPSLGSPTQQSRTMGSSFVDGVGFVMYASPRRRQFYRQPIRVKFW